MYQHLSLGAFYAIDLLNVFFVKEALLHQNVYVPFTGGLIKTHMPSIHGWMEVSGSHKAQGFSEGPEHARCRTADAALHNAKHHSKKNKNSLRFVLVLLYQVTITFI